MASSVKPNNTNFPIARLLRCRATQRFFTGRGWSLDSADAAIFQEPLEAVRACVSHNLQNIEMVLRVGRGHADLFSTVVR